MKLQKATGAENRHSGGICRPPTASSGIPLMLKKDVKHSLQESYECILSDEIMQNSRTSNPHFSRNQFLLPCEESVDLSLNEIDDSKAVTDY